MRTIVRVIGVVLCVLLLTTTMISPVLAWEEEVPGEINAIGPQPEIVEITMTPGSELWYGEEITISVKVRNAGDEAQEQSIEISFPENPPVERIKVFETPLSWTVYKPGDQLASNYGTGQVTLSYPLIKAVKFNWGKDEEYQLKVSVRPKSIGTFRIFVKTIARFPGGHRSDPTVEKSDGVDQQSEYIYTQSAEILFKSPQISGFEASGEPGQTVKGSFNVSNSNLDEITVEQFEILDKGGFTGSITAVNLPVIIPANKSKDIALEITIPASASGSYRIRLKISGKP